MIKNGARNQQYLEGYNATGSTIAKFLAVKGAYSSVSLPAAVSSPVFGFTTDSLADQTYGDIQIAGVAIATAGEALATVGTRVYADTDGKCYAWDAASGVNQSIIGTTMTVASGADDTFEILIGAGGIGQGA